MAKKREYMEMEGRAMRISYGLLLFVFLSPLFAPVGHAQSEPEYTMEVGVNGGLMNYFGDFSSKIAGNIQPAGGLTGRYLLNPRQGFRLELGYGKIKGTSEKTDTYYPEYQKETYSFSNHLIDLNATYEYNFWPFGTGKEYRGAKRLTPFVFGGLGATFCTGGGNKVFTGNIPIGVGLKYKVAQRLNLSLDWRMHFCMSDKLDGVKDPYGIKTSGMFKNVDCYSAVKLAITYSFKERCRVCHNSDE